MSRSGTSRPHTRLTPLQRDFVALAVLTLLWLFYFWRVLTLQVSLPEGDFSGQFVAFGAYQYDRMTSGEIPLWNPYNYGGSPFIGDTQSAVFYPLRLLTILGSYLTGGWTYASLHFEAVVHYWLAGLFMYLFVSRATDSRIAALGSAIIFAYGGFLTGYPPLQLALLEAAVWLPLILFGILKASDHRSGWSYNWLSVSSVALGVSLLAGHPQTSLLAMYTTLAYMIYRARSNAFTWGNTILGLVYLPALGFGLAAVQILPGLEYTRLTIRTALTSAELAAGFPFADLIVLLLPNVVTRWSPLYNGIAGLLLAGLAAMSGKSSTRFWGIVCIAALLLSFGGRTILYYLFASGLPGYTWFRGQERLAYIVAISISILAGYGIATLQNHAVMSKKAKQILGWMLAVVWFGAFQVMLVDGFFPAVNLFALKNGMMLLAILTTLTWLAVVRTVRFARSSWWAAGIIALLVFDAFSVTYQTNWERIKPSDRMQFSSLIDTPVVRDDLARVDGQWGLGGNYGSMLGLYDIRGISPLRLQALEAYQTALPQYRLHELLAVKYVFTDWEQLEVPSQVIAQDDGVSPPINLHELENPLPRAWLVTQAERVSSDDDAITRLQDPAFEPRNSVIVQEDPALQLDGIGEESTSVEIIRYEPEFIEVRVNSERAAILVVSEWDYPGWKGQIDNMPTRILRANGGLRAIPISAGEHVVTFRYQPVSVFAGAIISVLSLCVLGYQLGQLRRASKQMMIIR